MDEISRNAREVALNLLVYRDAPCKSKWSAKVAVMRIM